jgi:hypothetical protein
VTAITVLDPTADVYGDDAVSLAPRLRSLEGKVLGLLWNGKPLGDVALRLTGQLIAEKIPGVTVRFYSGSMPCSPALLDTMVAECDAVVACTADCGSCTSWLTHDVVQVERRGVPTVIIASAGFEDDVEASARAFAMPGIQYVLVPHVYNNLDDDQATAQTTPIVDEVIKTLTSGGLVRRADDDEEDPNFTFTSDEDDAYGPVEAFNAFFMDRDWGDGYPLHPATQERVSQLIDAVEGKPDDLVCLLPPGNGQATVAKVAVNAALAGCAPQDMPVVMAALRAIAKARPVPRIPLMSTGAHAPLFLVNGPIATEIGINGGRACLGPGKQNKVNIRISRAVVLCLKNLGNWYPGVMDLDSVGTTRKHIVVVAENEAESPWEPFHVSQGYQADESTVTLFFTSGEWDISIQGHQSARQLAASIASFSGGNNSTYLSSALDANAEKSGLGRLLFVPPPHAIPLSEGGFTKRAFEKFLFTHGQEPISRLIEPVRKLHADGKVKPEWEWLFDLPATEARNRTLPVIESADNYSVVVVGSVRAKDLLMPTRVAPTTEKVTTTPTS